MLSQELRPKTLDDMAGQEEAKKLLKAIIKNPENAPKVLLFCGSFGTGKCVVGDTRVHTSDGYKRIDSLIDAPKYDEEGFMDISSNHLRVVGSEATHYYYGGKKKVIEISSGRFKITGTYNHRVQVYGGRNGLQWKKLSEITTDDYVAIPLNHDILFNNKSKTYDFMKDDISERNKGYLLGTFFCNLLESGYKGDDSFDSFIFVHHSDDGFMGNLKDEYYNKVLGSNVEFSKGINRYMRDYFGNSCDVPEFVFSSNRDFICGFLTPICEFYLKGFYQFGNFSEKVARDLQQLFYLLGIITNIKVTNGVPSYLDVQDVLSRQRLVDNLLRDSFGLKFILGSSVNYKSIKLKIPNNNYTRSVARRIYQLIKENHNLDTMLLSHFMNIRCNDCRFITNRRTKSILIDSYHNIVSLANDVGVDISKDEMVQKFNSLLDDYMFVRVSSKKELYNKYDVYDLTVADTHAFTANGLINHNTTSSRIVGRELNNIKDENYDLLNSPFYYEFDSTIVGNVEEIRKLRDVFTVSYGDYWRVVVLDECVHYDTNIHVMDDVGNKFLMRIGRLVSKKPKGWKALSVDGNGSFSYKPILNFFNNGKRDFYKVEIDVSRMGSLSRMTNCTKNVICTDNHRFFDSNFNEVYLRDLKVGDVVSTFNDYSNNRILSRAIRNSNTHFVLNGDIIAFLRGSVLGDGSVDILRSGSLRYRFTQSCKHQEYFDVVKEIVGDLYCCDRVDKSGYGGKDILSVTSRVCDSFKDIFSNLFANGEKRITREYLESLTPLSIAVWYMDDGSLIHHYGKEKSISLSTHAYSKEENETIIEYFKDVHDIQFKMYYDKRCGKYSIGASRKEDRTRFLELVSPYVIDLFQYKLGEHFTCGNGIKNIDSIKENVYSGDFRFVGNGVIKSITPYKDSHVSAYDIEVADNHNYITGGGIILHNCHTVSATAQAAMLKMFEETKGRTIYILATTDPQKLLPTIRSRALEINFNDVPVEAIVDNLTRVSEEKNLNLSEDIKLLIADRSGGHMRNAHMLLDKYILLGEEDFKDSIKSSITLFCDYLIATYKNDKDTVLSTINDLLSIPKDNLQSDWSIVMTESLRSFCGFDCRHADIKRLVDTYGSDFNIIAQCYMSTWVKNMFIDVPYTQATLLNMYKVVQGALEKKRTQSGVGSVQSVASKYGRPVR